MPWFEPSTNVKAAAVLSGVRIPTSSPPLAIPSEPLELPQPGFCGRSGTAALLPRVLVLLANSKAGKDP